MPTTPTDIQVPASLPVLPGVAAAGRYLLTDVAPTNRGDTLDVLRLPDGRVAAMVADVVGNGFSAAIAATQLRTVLRESLLEGGDAVDCMASLHRLAAHTPEVASARLALMVLDLATDEVEYIAAGHPPPLLRCRDEPARVLSDSRCRPLGEFGPMTPGHAQAEDGAVLLLHTDGLTSGGAVAVGQVGEALDHELARARQVDGPSHVVETVGECLLDGVDSPAVYLDDVALVLLQRVPPPRELSLVLPAVPESVATVREELSHWLEDVGAGLTDQVGLCHAAGELARNVVDHAYRSRGAGGRLRHTACLEPDGHAVITVSDEGRWEEGVAAGHGLVMASGLADELRIRRTPAGSAIELRQELRRAVPLVQVGCAHVDDGRRGAMPVDGDLRTEASPGRLVAQGVVDEINVEMFHSALREATRAGTTDAVIDLSGLTLLASPGIQAILDVLRRSRHSGAHVRFVARPGSPSDQILDLVDIPHTA